MFSSFLGKTLAVPAMCCVMMLVGCKTSGSTASADKMSSPLRAVVATNHGQTTVFYVSDTGAMTESTSDGGKVCAECRTAAKGYFAGGKLPESCPACGAKLMATNTPPVMNTKKG